MILGEDAGTVENLWTSNLYLWLSWLIVLIAQIMVQNTSRELSGRVFQFWATAINRIAIADRHLLFHPAFLGLSLPHLQYAWLFSRIDQRQLVVAVDGINLNYFLNVSQVAAIASSHSSGSIFVLDIWIECIFTNFVYIALI